LEIITLDTQNIIKEDICCAIADQKCQYGVNLKKEWLKSQFNEGFTFRKFNVRGKVFIEYVPAENAWVPVDAPDYMYIQCFWVAGSYKGQGLGSQLLDQCIHDAKGKNGIIVVSSKNKKPFLADKKFFTRKGFEVCDTAPPYFELLVKKFRNNAPSPRFKDCTKKLIISDQNGLWVNYSDQCPFTDFYVQELAETARNAQIPFQKVKISTKETAQNNPSPFVTYSVYLNGSFLTHEILNKRSFDKLMDNLKTK
jgi:ribosomal protein S18 acetylase RimI-like enzyme